MIDLCGKYKECSMQGFCINPKRKESCTYNIKLQAGHNFYDESIKNRVCLQIGNRQFYIGKRSTYGNHSYNLEDEDIDKINAVIGELGKVKLVEGLIYKYCINDATTNTNRACCQVIWTIGDRKYNIKNFSVRAIVEDTAKKLREYLLSKGFSASIEYIGKKTSHSHNTYSTFVGSIASPVKPKQEKKELNEIIRKLENRGKVKKAAKQKVKDTQVNMFDLMMG